jgi:hypothetical protein
VASERVIMGTGFWVEILIHLISKSFGGGGRGTPVKKIY